MQYMVDEDDEMSLFAVSYFSSHLRSTDFPDSSRPPPVSTSTQRLPAP